MEYFWLIDSMRNEWYDILDVFMLLVFNKERIYLRKLNLYYFNYVLFEKMIKFYSKETKN